MNRKGCPLIKLDVSKDGSVFEQIELEGKAVFIFGQLEEKCDILMLHPSVSRIHAIILIDENSNPLLIDVGSKSGTKVNEKPIPLHTPYPLKDGMKIVFGLST
jgi:pSer/pThr/pTyr-binding forkhead associated (FHA) protein